MPNNHRTRIADLSWTVLAGCIVEAFILRYIFGPIFDSFEYSLVRILHQSPAPTLPTRLPLWQVAPWTNVSSGTYDPEVPSFFPLIEYLSSALELGPPPPPDDDPSVWPLPQRQGFNPITVFRQPTSSHRARRIFGPESSMQRDSSIEWQYKLKPTVQSKATTVGLSSTTYQSPDADIQASGTWRHEHGQWTYEYVVWWSSHDGNMIGEEWDGVNYIRGPKVNNYGERKIRCEVTMGKCVRLLEDWEQGERMELDW